MIEIIKALVACMESAIEAGDWQIDGACDPTMDLVNARKAIAEAEKQEPDKYAMDIECTKCGAQQSGILTVNTTPQQRTWVGLTDEEFNKICSENHPLDGLRTFVQAIEAKLKQKNGYTEEKNT